MQAHHHVMKIRGDINAVSEAPDGGHALLAAFLEATDKIDQRALQRRGVLVDARDGVNLEPVNLEADSTTFDVGPALLETAPTLVEEAPAPLEVQLAPMAPDVRVTVAPFIFRRANLVRASK